MWSGLIQEPPVNAPTQTIVGFMGDKKTLPLVPITVNVLGQIITVDALIYDQSPVDLLLGRNCPDFRQIIYEAEGLQQTFAVTRQQIHQEEAEDIQLESMNDNFDHNSFPEVTPFNMIIGNDYDYPQSNLSTIAASDQVPHTLDTTDKNSLIKGQEMTLHYVIYGIRLKEQIRSTQSMTECFIDSQQTVTKNLILRSSYPQIVVKT